MVDTNILNLLNLKSFKEVEATSYFLQDHNLHCYLEITHKFYVAKKGSKHSKNIMNRGLKVRIYDAYSISSSNGRSYYGPSPSMNIFMQKLYLRISFYSRHTQPSSNAPSLLAKLICNRELPLYSHSLSENNDFTDSPIHDFGFKNRFTIY